MILKLTLTRGSSHVQVPLLLPATQEEIGEAFAKLDRIGTGSTKVAELSGHVRQLSQYIRGIDPDSPDDVQKLNRLSQRVDDMTQRQLAVFCGALDAEMRYGLNNVLSVLDNLEDYTLIPGVTNDERLGRHMVNGGILDCPERLLPYLDHQAIGAFTFSERSGVYTTEGYVVKRSELPSAVQSADAPYPTPHMENSPEIIRMELETRQTRMTVILPADEEYLDEVRRRLGIEDFTQAKLRQCSCEVVGLADVLPMDCIRVEDANELALAVNEMMETDGELLKFCSVLAVEQPGTFGAALHLAEELNLYDRVPGDPVEYAKQELAEAGAGEEILGIIRGYTDFDALGRASMERDGVVQTEYGFVRRLDEPFQSQSPGEMQMI